MTQPIDIPFNDWSTERHEQEVKTATTRTERYGAPGDRFVDAGKLFELTHVVQIPLAAVADYFWEEEGADSAMEYRAVWKELHPKRGFDPEQPVWLHLYREVTDRGR